MKKRKKHPIYKGVLKADFAATDLDVVLASHETILARLKHLSEQVSALPVREWRESIAAMSTCTHVLQDKINRLGTPESIQLGGHTFVRQESDDRHGHARAHPAG